MAVTPQASLPTTITDADPNIPGSGTPATATSVMPNFQALRDAYNTHGHTDLALNADLNTHTQLTTAAHGGIVADADYRVNSFFNVSKIVSSFTASTYLRQGAVSIANPSQNILRAARIIAPATGTLFDLSIFVGTASGNVIAGIYNTAGTRASQFNSGSTPMAGTNAWQVLAFNSTLSTTVTGTQTVSAGNNLTVASTTGFSKIGSIVNAGTTYAYTAVPSGTTITLTAGGTFTGSSTVTQAGLSVTAGTHYDVAIIMDNATGTYLQHAVTGSIMQLPTNNFLVVSGGALPKLAWTNSPGSFTWPASVTEANASNATTLVPLLLARVT